MATDKAPEAASVVGLFLGLAWIFFSLRVYVKTFVTKGWTVDDLLLGCAIAMFTTYCISAAVGIKYGTGKHLEDIQRENIPKALYCWWLCEVFYTISTVFTRFAIAVFLLRICVKRSHKIIIHTTMAVVLVFSIFYFFLVLFQCSPVDFFWNQYRGAKGDCLNPVAIPNASIAHSAVSFTADWILGLLPIALIWNLQMNQRTKISIVAILALAVLAGIATIVRIPYIRVLEVTDNFLYATTEVAIWSTVEAGLGIVAASAASLRPLFRSLYNVSSRATPQYQGKSNSRRAGYPSNKEISNLRTGDTTRATDNYDNGIPLHDSPTSPNPAGTSRSPFGDSSEDVGHGSGGGIQVQRTFEVRTGETESVRSGSHTPTAWPNRPGTATSDTDIV